MAVDERGVKKKKGRSNEVGIASQPSLHSLRAIYLTTPYTGIHRSSAPALKDKPPSQPPGTTRATQLS